MKSFISVPRKLQYSMGSFGVNLIGITLTTWLLYFYSPPADSGLRQYLPIGLVGVLLAVCNLWDAVIDPFIGQFSDSSRSRWGRRRPFLAIGAPIEVIALVLIFLPPAKGSVLLIGAFLLVMRLIFFTSHSMVCIPYDGLLAEMTPDMHERVSLSGLKNIFGLLGVLVGSVVAGLLFNSLGAAVMAAVVGAIGLIAIYTSIGSIRENTRENPEPAGAFQGIVTTLKNGQFLIYSITIILVNISYSMFLMNLPYFVTLIAGKSSSDEGLYMGAIVLTMMAFAFIWMGLTKRFKSKRLFNISLYGFALTLVLNAAVGLVPGIPPAVHALVGLIVTAPFLGGFLILSFAIMGNVVDYDELLTSRRREAVYYGSFSLAAGIGTSFSSLVLSFLYKNFGFTTANPLGVRLSFVAMGIFVIMGAVFYTRYKLGDSLQESRKNMGLAAEAGKGSDD